MSKNYEIRTIRGSFTSICYFGEKIYTLLNEVRFHSEYRLLQSVTVQYNMTSICIGSYKRKKKKISSKKKFFVFIIYIRLKSSKSFMFNRLLLLFVDLRVVDQQCFTIVKPCIGRDQEIGKYICVYINISIKVYQVE